MTESGGCQPFTIQDAKDRTEVWCPTLTGWRRGELVHFGKRGGKATVRIPAGGGFHHERVYPSELLRV